MKNKKIVIAMLLLAPIGTMLAQVHNTGILYVSDSAELYTNSAYTFGDDGASTKTTRGANHGIVSLSAEATNASIGITTNTVDGFVNIIPSTGTLLYKSPVGFGAFDGFIDFSVTNLQPILSAFYRTDPSEISASISAEIEKISTVEYWKVNSNNNGKVTIYWNAQSSLGAILEGRSVAFLSILGFNGSEWLPVTTDVIRDSETSTTTGSLVTSQNIDLADYSHFTIGSLKDLACYDLITYSGDGNIKTWNGSWNPSAPVINDKIIINAPLSITSDLECYSVEINADITMDAGKKLTVVNGFSGTGKIVMSNLASVI